MPNTYYLSLGANIDAQKNLQEAVRLLAESGRIIAVSSVYESPPLGARRPQSNYLNVAVVMVADFAPSTFRKEVLLGIEHALGRVRTKDRYASRPIDIDIMLVDDRVFRMGRRNVPSDEIMERNFVAVPLAEIAPDTRHPVTGETLQAIAEKLVAKLPVITLRKDIQIWEEKGSDPQ